MRSWSLLALLFVATACSSVPVAKRCEVIQAKQQKTSCEPLPDGHGVHCFAGDLAPASWGVCVELLDESWTCKLDGVIRHRTALGRTQWSVAANVCPALSKQLDDLGRDHFELGPVEIEPHTDPDRRKL